MALAALALVIPSVTAQRAAKLSARATGAVVTQQANPDNARNTFQDVQMRSAATASSRMFSAPVMSVLQPSNNTLANQIRQATGGITINGNVIYSNPAEGQTSGNAHLGIYSFDTSGQNFTELLHGNLGCYAAVVVDGVYYNYVAVQTILGYTFYARTYSTETWEQLSSKSITNAKTPRALATDGTNVYGCFYNGQSGDNAGYEYGKLDLTTNEHTVICTLPQNWNACAWGNDGMIYAIDMLGDCYKVVPTTGAMTKVGATGRVPKYVTGACVDKKSGRMFWTLCPEDENGYLMEVNTTTGAATQLCKFQYGDEIAGLYVPFIADDKAPAAVTDLNCVFNNGSLSGKINFKAPTTLFDGTAATGEVDYKILVNGEVAATGKCAYGANVSKDLTVGEAGTYTITVVLSNAKGDGPKVKKELFIGADTPKSTKVTIAYENGKFNVKWNAVTETVNGGYMDLSKLTYKVTRMPDSVVVAEKATATSLQDAVATPATYTLYYYTVVVNCDGKSSAVAESNKIGLGEIAAPYSESFDTADAFELYTVIDANNDGKTWTYNATEKAVRAAYNSKNEMDDWLITPGIKLEAGKTYRIAADLRNHSANSYPEKFEIKIGNAPEASAMTTTLVPLTQINGKVWTTFDEYFTPTTTGTYNIGIHGVSDKNMFYLWADNITVSAPIDGGAPDAVTALEATADQTGALKAVISGKAPTKTLNGSTLSSISSIIISRDGTPVKTLTGIQPGGNFSYTDAEVPTNGNHTWQVVCTNDKGQGKKAEISTFVGFDKPSPVTNVTTTETSNGKVHITWTAPTTDINGKPLGSTPITYKLVKASATTTVYADNLSATSFDMDVVTEGQEFFQVGVFAVTAIGTSTGTAGPFMAVGFPYTLPYYESFAEKSLSSILGLQKVAGDGATWTINKDGDLGINSADNDGGFMSGKMSNLNDAGMVFTGKIDLTTAAKPVFKFHTYNIISEKDGELKYDINEIDVKIREVGTEEWTVLKHGTVNELCNGDTGVWKPVQVSLDAYKGKKVQVGIQGTCKYYVYVMIDKLQVCENLDHNLGVSGITAPENVKPNEEFAINVEVENRGSKNSEAYSVEFYRDNATTPFKTIEGLAIAPGAIATFSAPVKLTFADEDAQATYKAVVKYSKDENAADNTSDVVTVKRQYSSKPGPQQLEASVSSGSTVLKWKAPSAQSTERMASGNLYDLESYESWNNTGIDGWQFIDMDKKPRGGFEGLEIPNNAVQSLGSWFVFEQGGNFNESFKAHSGTKFFASLFNYDASQVDDWLISPALSGSAQTLTFWAKSYSKNYLEDMEVLTSSTNANTESFTSAKVVKSVPADWTEYTIQLPAGTKYFAIRNNGTDKFLLMVDDLTFETVPDVVVGYNVYRDNVKINSELIPATQTTYTDANVTDKHTYHVTAVYQSGEESAPSNGATTNGVAGIEAGVSVVAGQGFIAISGAEGKQVSIIGINGITFFNAVPENEVRVEVAPGVYMVRVANGTMKLVVK